MDVYIFVFVHVCVLHGGRNVTTDMGVSCLKVDDTFNNTEGCILTLPYIVLCIRVYTDGE